MKEKAAATALAAGLLAMLYVKDRGLFTLVMAATVILTVAVTVLRRVAGSRSWQMRRRVWLRLRPGDGFASHPELWTRWSKVAAAFDHGRRARPSMGRFGLLFTRTTDYAVRLGRAWWFKRVFGRMQDQTLILSPPQMGKSGLLMDRIIDHPGPVLCTSTRPDLFTNTAGERYRRGPVSVFNPLGLGGIPSTFGWRILAGCDNPGTAIRRAQDLTGDYPTGDMKWWQSKASAALAALLHAAALAPWGTIVDVYEWVNRWNDAMAEEILAANPAASPQLRALLDEIRKDGKTADSVRATISECLTWVAVPELAASVNLTDDDDGFDVSDFIASCGTLYMIAPGNETAPVAPLFQAFVQHVHYEASLIAARLPSGKLDPPLWYALDELTQVCPLPLPSMLADSAGKGILISAVVHSYGQLEQRWGKSGAETVWATSATKILMGGITDPVTLEHITRICGTDDDGACVPADLIRVLPKWRALVITLDKRPVVVKTRPAWHRRERRFGRAPALAPLLPLVPRPRVPVLTPDQAAFDLPGDTADVG